MSYWPDGSFDSVRVSIKSPSSASPIAPGRSTKIAGNEHFVHLVVVSNGILVFFLRLALVWPRLDLRHTQLRSLECSIDLDGGVTVEDADTDRWIGKRGVKGECRKAPVLALRDARGYDLMQRITAGLG